MPLTPIKLNPGISTQPTALLNEGSWSEAANLRWQYGLAQKDGGFREFTSVSTAAGLVQALRAWTSLSGRSYLAIACQRRLFVFLSEAIYDITPKSISGAVTPALTTTSGSPDIVIADAAHNPSVGEFLQIHDPVSVDGLALYGSFSVSAVTPGVNYTIVAAANASSGVTGGNVRVFTTTAGSAVVNVNLPDHGLFTGQVTSSPDPLAIGGITLLGNYVVTVVDQNNYTITAASPATSAATVSENGGMMQIQFFNTSGGTQQDFNATLWSSMANWGEFLMWAPKDGPVYVWQPALGTSSPATNVATAPQSNRYIFVATQEQMLFVLGTVNAATGLFDPMLVAWSDAGDYTDFTPTVTNQAGSFRLSAGSTIIAGLALAGGNLIWTDLALYSAQYLQPPLVWGFQPIGLNCGLVGPYAFGTIGQQIFWMSRLQFYYLAGGAPQVLPCSVWDAVFKNLDPANLTNVVCETNAFYNEVSWEVPQIGGTVVRARVQIDTGLWTYTILPLGAALPRTAWIDQSVFGAPLASDPDNVIWQHETGNDAGTSPLEWFIKSGIVMIAEGDEITFVRDVQPDLKFTADGSPGPGVVEMRMYLYDRPQDPPRSVKSAQITSRTRTLPRMRGRGRGVQFEFRGTDLGSMPRLGLIRYRGARDGRR